MVNFYIDPSFFWQAALAIVLFRTLAPLLPAWGRQGLLLILSAFFLSELANFSTFAIPLAVLVLAVVGFGQLLARAPGWAKWALVGSACIVAAGAMVVHRYPSLLAFVGLTRTPLAHVHGVRWIGLSYLAIKAIDYCLAVQSDRMAQDQRRLGWWAGAAYLVFFPGFVEGPINRFGAYVAEQTQPWPRLTWHRLAGNLRRIAIGLVKLLAFAPLAQACSIRGPGFRYSDQISLLALSGAVYWFYLYRYWLFSGYCDVAIALADFFDVRLPENFDYPIFASGPQDFWNRWHISLSHWMRDVVFFRLLRLILKRLPRVPDLAAAMFSMFVTFVLVGVWHDAGLNWFLWGGLQGLALCLELAYRSLMETFWPDLYERLVESRAYRLTCVLATFNFVAWGLLLTRPLPALQEMAGRLTW